MDWTGSGSGGSPAGEVVLRALEQVHLYSRLGYTAKARFEYVTVARLDIDGVCDERRWQWEVPCEEQVGWWEVGYLY